MNSLTFGLPSVIYLK